MNHFKIWRDVNTRARKEANPNWYAPPALLAFLTPDEWLLIQILLDVHITSKNKPKFKVTPGQLKFGKAFTLARVMLSLSLLQSKNLIAFEAPQKKKILETDTLSVKFNTSNISKLISIIPSNIPMDI